MTLEASHIKLANGRTRSYRNIKVDKEIEL